MPSSIKSRFFVNNETHTWLIFNCKSDEIFGKIKNFKIELDVTLSIRVWQVIALGIALALAYLNKGNKSK